MLGHGAWPGRLLRPNRAPAAPSRPPPRAGMSRLNKALSAPLFAAEDWSVDLCTPRDRTSPGPWHPRCRVAVQLSLTALAQSCTSSSDAGICNAGRPSTACALARSRLGEKLQV